MHPSAGDRNAIATAARTTFRSIHDTAQTDMLHSKGITAPWGQRLTQSPLWDRISPSYATKVYVSRIVTLSIKTFLLYVCTYRPVSAVPISHLLATPSHVLLFEMTNPAFLSRHQVPNNISKYNYKDRMYKVDPPGPGDHLAMHLAIDGWALFREGDEAKLQVGRSTTSSEVEEVGGFH